MKTLNKKKKNEISLSEEKEKYNNLLNLYSVNHIREIFLKRWYIFERNRRIIRSKRAI